MLSVDETAQVYLYWSEKKLTLRLTLSPNVPGWGDLWMICPYKISTLSHSQKVEVKIRDMLDLSWVNCWDKILLNESWKMLLSEPSSKLNNIFQDEFRTILSQ